MRTIEEEVTDGVTAIEEEVVARFYDYVGLGEDYRAGHSIAEFASVSREFRGAGFKIFRLELGKANTFRMILSCDGIVRAWQDITIKIDISPMGGV